MCGIQAGFDGKSLLPLNFRSLSGASPLPPHPPFPLFLRPTSSLHWEHSPCTRALRAGAAPHPPGGGGPHSRSTRLWLHLSWGPYTLLLALPPSQTLRHTWQPSALGGGGDAEVCTAAPRICSPGGHFCLSGPSHQLLCGQACFSLQLSLQPLSGVRLHFPARVIQ